jgi:hypothetical protein
VDVAPAPRAGRRVVETRGFYGLFGNRDALASLPKAVTETQYCKAIVAKVPVNGLFQLIFWPF